MPCSAVECRSEGTSMPLPVIRPILDTSDYRSTKFSSTYNRRFSASRPIDTDISRYTSTRSALLSRSEESRDRSISRDSSLSRSITSRSRTASYSDSSTKPTRKVPPLTFDVHEFRSIYAPSSYITGSARSEQSSRPPKPTSTTELTRTRTAPVVAKEKRADEAANNLEVTTDENHNIAVEESVVERNSGSADKPLEVNSSQSSQPKDDEPTLSDTSSDLDSFQPRNYGKPLILSTKKESLVTDTNGLSGLRNIGNTCFLNSVVQCLSNTRLLKDFFISREYVSEINNSESKGALIKSFADVVCELWSGEGKIVNTSSFKSQIQKYAPRFMGYNQQDAQEFLRYLLQGIHDDINRVSVKPRNLPPVDDNLSDSLKASECWKQYLKIDNSRIVDLFVGQLKSTLKCTVCGHCSTTFEVFWDLSLPLPSRTNTLKLSQCIEHFTKEEVLDGDEMPTCSKCKTRRKCTKSFSIQKFPRILVLHLKRFSPSERYRKLSATVEFPLTGLDMSPYASNTQVSACLYNLYAVSNHSGTAYSGHYTAYCLHPHSHQWHEYNDARVSSISGRNVTSSEAYILFYEQASGSSVTTSRL